MVSIPADPIRVLLADDHPVVLTGLRALFEDESDIVIVGEATDGRRAVDLARALRPDVVLLDMRMPGLDGVAATERLVALGLGLRVLIVSTSDDEADVVMATRAGASGYVLKHASADDLIGAVRAVAAGETVLSPSAAAKLAAHVRGEPGRGKPIEPLSARELEVLRGAARGLTNIQIGDELHIAEATVKTHLQRVFDKLGVRDRTAAVTSAIRLGLISPEP